MRIKLRSIMFALALGVMCVSVAEARENRRTDSPRKEHAGRPAGSHRPDGSSRRPGSSQRPSGSKGHRPSGNSRPAFGNNQGDHNGNHHGNNHGGNHNRPGNGNCPGGNGRPSGGHVTPGNGHKPGHGWHGNGRPGGNHGNRPGYHRPGVGHRPPHLAPPHRPHRPVMHRPHMRPLPPPSWRPRRGLPVIHGILGLTFGVAISSSLDYLYNSGYTVDGYGNDVVYLRNVPVLNYMWTDGALYYGAGGLDASSFYYTTPVYDPVRYNAVYNSLVRTYGVPVSYSNTGGVMTSTWFGGNNGYITLSLGSGPGGRFLTTLTFGL